MAESCARDHVNGTKLSWRITHLSLWADMLRAGAFAS